MLKYLGQSTTGKLHTSFGVGTVDNKGEVTGIKSEDAKKLSEALPNLFEYKASSTTSKATTAKKEPTEKKAPATKRATTAKKEDDK